MAVDIFLHLANNIKGEAQDSVHGEKIDILAWNWSMDQSGTTHMGGGGGGGKVDVHNMTLTKYVDTASHDLIKRCCSGEHIADGQLIVRKSGGAAPVEYLKIDMKKVMISSYQTGGSKDGLDRVQETFELNFAYFQVTYTKQEDDGAAGPESIAGWSINENVEWAV